MTRKIEILTTRNFKFEPDKVSLKSLWDEFKSDSSDALFSLDVFNYEWKQDERNQLRFIKAILYGSPSDRVHPILREKSRSNL